MKSSFVLFISIALVLSLSFNLQADADAASLETVCEKVADAIHDANFTNRCVSTLQVNSTGPIADEKDLAILATDLLLANFTNVLNKTNELLQINDTNNIANTADALKTCVIEIGAAVIKLQEATAAFTLHNYLAALYDLYRSFTHFHKCERALLEQYCQSHQTLDALVGDFSVVEDTSTIAFGIASFLKNSA